MLIKIILLIIIGFAGGLIVASGVFAFLVMIGVITRLAARTRTSRYIPVYETAVILGGTSGNLVSLFQWKLPVGFFGLAVYGLFSGVFIGCLAMALAEVLKVMPIMAKRIHLKFGMSYIVTAIALGKCFGTILQYWYDK